MIVAAGLVAQKIEVIEEDQLMEFLNVMKLDIPPERGFLLIKEVKKV